MKEILEINIIGFKIPNGGSQTIWLAASMTEDFK